MATSTRTYWAKRPLDVFVAAVGLVLLAPVLALIALLVRMKLGSPILFTQIRPGLHGRPFRMFKFRSMTDARDAAGNLLPDSDRLPPFGRFLRASSLDELPELWNVLKGDMSIVGPRPLLIEYLAVYTPEQARRHELRPGISGWAQINGRNGLSWDDKFRLDVWYVEHCSFLVDLRIFLLSWARLFRPRGVSAPNSVTAEKFTGTSAR
jgi:lipopolysaccharide/colanic/teichoic acid biosynthesis glycosyltransferase